jgi:hypothetical protein
MGKRRNVQCRWCSKHRDEVGPISRSGACQACAAKRILVNVALQCNPTPEMIDRWAAGIATAAARRKRLAAQRFYTIDHNGHLAEGWVESVRAKLQERLDHSGQSNVDDEA